MNMLDYSKNKFYTVTMKRLLGGFLLVAILLGLVASTHIPVAAIEQVPTLNNGHQARIEPGEPYSQLFTNEMAEEIAAWVLDTYPELPFNSPHVEIHEDGIVCSGVIDMLGVNLAASGRIAVFVEDGKMNGRIEEIKMAGITLPGVLLDAVDDVRSLYESATWEIVVTNVTLSEGELLVEGTYR